LAAATGRGWLWGPSETIGVLSHRPIVLTDTIDYQTIGFSHNRPNPSLHLLRNIVVIDDVTTTETED